MTVDPPRTAPPRIAYVVNSMEGGGAALPLPDVVAVLEAAGARVRVLALSRRDGRAAPALEAAGVDLRVCPAGPRDHAAAMLWLLRELRAHRPALIWTSLVQATLLGQVAGLLTRTPVVSWQHNARLKPANLALLRATRRSSALWVADSEAVAALTRARLGLEGDAVRVWPLLLARPPARAPALRREGEPWRIGSLGRLHPNKGYDVLVEALALLLAKTPGLRGALKVTVGGEGAQRPALEAAARRAGLDDGTLRFAGFQASPDAYLAGLHAYVQPSRAEGLCIAAHQAMAAGLPVVVSNVGEAPVTAAGGAGRVVPPGDAPALAAALRALTADPAAAARMGGAARARVLERFGEDRFRAAGADVAARALALVARPPR